MVGIVDKGAVVVEAVELVQLAHLDQVVYRLVERDNYFCDPIQVEG